MSLKTELETKVPPPLLGFATALMMWLIAQLLPSMSMLSENLQRIGMVLMAVGIAIDIAALRQFLKVKTSYSPLNPGNATTFVANGLYKYTRNPMYLGLTILLTGWGLYLDNLASLVCLPIFVIALKHLQILPEERILHEKFGESYEHYRQHVRRWI